VVSADSFGTAPAIYPGKPMQGIDSERGGHFCGHCGQTVRAGGGGHSPPLGAVRPLSVRRAGIEKEARSGEGSRLLPATRRLQQQSLETPTDRIEATHPAASVLSPPKKGPRPPSRHRLLAFRRGACHGPHQPFTGRRAGCEFAVGSA